MDSGLALRAPRNDSAAQSSASHRPGRHPLIPCSQSLHVRLAVSVERPKDARHLAKGFSIGTKPNVGMRLHSTGIMRIRMTTVFHSRDFARVQSRLCDFGRTSADRIQCDARNVASAQPCDVSWKQALIQSIVTRVAGSRFRWFCTSSQTSRRLGRSIARRLRSASKPSQLCPGSTPTA